MKGKRGRQKIEGVRVWVGCRHNEGFVLGRREEEGSMMAMTRHVGFEGEVWRRNRKTKSLKNEE